MKTAILNTLICLVVITSCTQMSSHSNEVISLESSVQLSRILMENYISSAVYTENNIYFMDSKRNIYKSNLSSIYQWYKLGFVQNYSSLSQYIYTIFNQKLVKDDSITIRSMLLCGKLDSILDNQYKMEGMTGVVKRYCKYSSSKKHYLLKDSFISENLKESVAYLFFLNGYLKGESDVIYRVVFYPFPKEWRQEGSVYKLGLQ